MGEEPGERKELISRIGTFFLLLGVGLIILFIGSDMMTSTNFTYFFVGVIALSVAWYFKRITATPPKPSARFEALRKLRQKQQEAKAKRLEGKKDAKK